MDVFANAFSEALGQTRGAELDQEAQNALRTVLSVQDELLRTAIGLVFISERRDLLQRQATDWPAEAQKQVGRKLQADAAAISSAARNRLDEASSYGYLLAGMWLESAALRSLGKRAGHEILERFALTLESALSGKDSAAPPSQHSSYTAKIIIKCPFCSQRLRVSSAANSEATCPRCHTVIDLDAIPSKHVVQ